MVIFAEIENRRITMTMKRIFFAAMTAFAAAAVLAGCKEPDYEAKIMEKTDAFSEFYRTLACNTDISEDAKDQMLDSCYEVLSEEVEAIAMKALRKHTDDSIAVSMVGVLYSFEILDNDALLKLIEGLGPNAQADPDIAHLKDGLEILVKTGEGTQFVDFAIEQPDGKVRKLSDFAGNGSYCLVDFWASWCGPCKREIPNLKKIYEKYGGKGLEMVSVAVWDDPQESIDTARAYGIQWHQIVNAQKIPTELYGIQGIPHIMLIGPDGVILKRDLRGDDIARTIARYL